LVPFPRTASFWKQPNYARFQQQSAKESLVLVEPSDIEWLRRDKARVFFRLQNCDYDLPLTHRCYIGYLNRLATGGHQSAELVVAAVIVATLPGTDYSERVAIVT
jgi:hypothetical protein